MNIKHIPLQLLCRLIVWMLIFLILAVVWSSFEPPLVNLIRDDSMVMSERAWAKNNLDWLWHLLFFSQNRYTSGGDYFLFRPILFLHTWYMDVFFRGDRAIHYWVSVSIGFFTAGSIFWVNKKKIPFFFAAALGIFFLIYPDDRIVFQWSHISPYLLGVAFYGLGIYLLVCDLEGGKSNLSIDGVGFLFLASLCQELVPVSILALLIYTAFARETDFKFIIKNLSLVLFCYLFFYFSTIILSGPLPGFFSHGEWSNFIKLLGNRNAEGNQHFENILLFAIPEGKKILGIFISIVLIVTIPRIKFLRTEKWMLLAFLIPLACLVMGLFLSRIVIRGGFSPWYRVMFLYYVIMICGVLFGVLFRMGGARKLLCYLLALPILTLICFSSINLYKNLNTQAANESNNITWVKNYFREHPKECFGGLEGVNNPYISEINLILYELSCEHLQDLKPTYFSAMGDKWTEVDQKKLDVDSLKSLDISPIIILPSFIEQFQIQFSKQSQHDYWFSRNGYSSESLKYGCYQSKPINLRNLQIEFRSFDFHPIFYNTFIILADKSGKVDLISLSGNRAEIWIGATNVLEKFKLKSTIYLNKITSDFTLDLKFDDRVFINNQLIGSIYQHSKLSKRAVVICSFDNATPAEIIKSITSSNP